jgi:hypothetical protein
MNERETLTSKAAVCDARHSRQRLAAQLGGLPVAPDLVGAGNSGAPCYLGHFRLAGLAKQALVNEVSIVDSNTKPNKRGRPVSSSDIYLSPHFRNPVDIERLGKALVSIALKRAVQLDDDDNSINGDGGGKDGGNNGMVD